jgi:cation diffusion facilitator family transporter
MGTRSERSRFARATWANVIGNTAKILAEGGAGLAFGSAALVADAAHSIADLVASLVVLVWGDSRFEDADTDHPHGHARIEPLTALFVGGVIVLLGGYLLSESLLGVLGGTDIEFSPVLVGALGVAILDMYLVYWYTDRMNEGLDAPALRALAADCLNDLYTSVGALVGVLGVALGVSLFDPLAGALVSLLVVYQGVTIARENLTYLSGRAAPQDRRSEIREVLLAHESVYGVHDLAVFYEGPQLEVEAHVEVAGELTLEEAHSIESTLVETVLGFDDVGDVHLHLDPEGVGEWETSDRAD